MKTAIINGASDDLIEVAGDFYEEFYPNEEGQSMLAFDDGTLLSVIYDRNGIWRVDRLFQGTAAFSKVEGDVENDTNDVVTLTGELKWVLCGNTMAKVKKDL